MRVTKLGDFVGQERLKKHLEILIKNATKSGKLDHILLTGLSGFGKTTISRILAEELGWDFLELDGSSIESSDVAKRLYMRAVDKKKQSIPVIVYIDEIHGLKKDSEGLLKIMEDKAVLGKPINFTLVGSTNRVGLLPTAFLNRFQIKHNFEKYSVSEMVQVIKNSAKAGGISVDAESCALIAGASRGVPREAQNILRRAYDFGVAITTKEVEDTLYLLGLDKNGLTIPELKYLNGIEKRQNSPQSLKNLEVITGEDAKTIEYVMEPYLIEMNLVDRTPRGRQLTAEGLEYIGSELPPPGVFKML